MKRTIRWTTAVLALGIAATALPATGAYASSEGRRNTAWVATAAAGVLAYRYAQKPSTARAVPAAAATGAAVYAWTQYSKSRRTERDRERAALVRYGRRTAYANGNGHRVAGYRGSKAKHRGRR